MASKNVVKIFRDIIVFSKKKYFIDYNQFRGKVKHSVYILSSKNRTSVKQIMIVHKNISSSKSHIQIGNGFMGCHCLVFLRQHARKW